MTEPQVKKPTRKQGYLYCDTCKSTVPYLAMGVPELDMPFPMHRCGRDIAPFTGWREEKAPPPPPPPELTLRTIPGKHP